MAKGSMIDLFYIITILVPISIGLIIIVWFANFFMPILAETVSGQTAQDITGNVTQTTNTFDSIFLMVAFGSPVVLIILAFQIRTHPAFFVMGLLIFIILLFLTPLYSNIIRSIANFELYSGIFEGMPFMSTIFQNYPLFVLGMGIISLIVIYSRRGEEV